MATRAMRRAAGVVLLAGVSTALAVRAQGPVRPPQGQPAAAQGPKAGDAYMNVLVLKDTPAAELHDTMVFFAASLGTTCETCHVRTGQGEMVFDRDDKPTKLTARRMIEMVRGINATYFNGRPPITCNTCHAGRRSPVPVPALASPFDPTARPPAEGGDRPAPDAKPAETVDQVVDKYLQALGGRDAVARIATRVMTGSITDRAGRSLPVTVEEKGGRYRIGVASTPPLSRGFDGTAAWVEGAGGGRALEGAEMLAVTRAASLDLPRQIKDGYAGLAVRSYDTIDGRDVIVLAGRPSPNVTETLSFDRESGLLLRRRATIQLSMGQLPVQVDYADYRVVDGVKTPFEMRVADWESERVQKFTTVTLNAPLDDVRFARPGRTPAR